MGDCCVAEPVGSPWDFLGAGTARAATPDEGPLNVSNDPKLLWTEAADIQKTQGTLVILLDEVLWIA